MRMHIVFKKWFALKKNKHFRQTHTYTKYIQSGRQIINNNNYVFLNKTFLWHVFYEEPYIQTKPKYKHLWNLESKKYEIKPSLSTVRVCTLHNGYEDIMLFEILSS